MLIALVALAVRLPGLGHFMTVDEENWMLRAGTFAHQLWRNHHPSGTFLTTHPGATTMWLSGAGILVQEARLGFDIDQGNLRYFRLAATLPMALATAGLIGLVAYLLSGLLGRWPGATAGLMLATDPYLMGMSQIVHLDALLALLMLVSVCAFLRNNFWLAGIATGLALANKFLPALWLLVFFAGYMLLAPGVRHHVLYRIRILGLVGGAAALTLYAAWPALWVKDDFFRSFERDVSLVVTQEHVALEVTEDPIEPASFYGRTLLGRATPFVLILVAGSIVAAGRAWRQHRRVPLVAWFVFYAAGYLALITFAAKKADRYALPALVMLPVIAGAVLGLAAHAWQRRAGRWPMVFLVVLLLSQALLWLPHAIAYTNPLWPNVRPLSQQGWGEGLEAVARQLTEHPLGDRLTVASWYPGVFGTYFDGKTMSLSSRHDDRVGYVVLYRNMAGRGPDDEASGIFAEFANQEPASVFSLHGVPYVWVYETLGPHYFRQHPGEITGGIEVGQTVPVDFADWTAIDIAMATFSSRANTEDVILHVRENMQATEDLRTVVVNARDIDDGGWQRFAFEPIPGSAGKTYYVALSSPTSVPGNAITVRYAAEDIRPGHLVLQEEAQRGDMAYRLPH